MSDANNPTEKKASWALGLDLGTTRCSLAATAINTKEDPAVKEQAIGQISAPGELTQSSQLPSFLYFPVEAELANGALDLPWQTQPKQVAGQYARDRAALVPGRVAHSAKSWLSHDAVDRHGAILPWNSADDVEKLSPVQVSATYLRHLRESWDRSHPDAPMAEQDLVLTVPASFDPVARQLTREAAELAGLGQNFSLLEEPQAAFYAWLNAMGPDWRKQVHAGDLILVIDLGGGTTDFSLIGVSDDDGQLQLERLAVGQHILLGGDNMDLALAYTLRAQLEAQDQHIDDWQFGALTHACRAAKERMLNDENITEQRLNIPSRGRALLGAGLSVVLDRASLEQVVLDGFFPMVAADAQLQRSATSALHSLGLPYAQDAAISRHLLDFLRRHAGHDSDGQAAMMAKPSALLFNGGVTRSEAIREALVEMLIDWMAEAGAPMPRVLSGSNADLAVAHGAAYYAAARRGRGLRIRGGTARSYYLGIERAEMAIPGMAPRIDALCIAPFGMEEGSSIALNETMALIVGEAATFRFFASAQRPQDKLGQRVDPKQAELEELPPLEVELEGRAGEMQAVKISAEISALGTLELAAEEVQSQKRHRLEFNIQFK